MATSKRRLSGEEALRLFDQGNPAMVMNLRDIQRIVRFTDAQLMMELQSGFLRTHYEIPDDMDPVEYMLQMMDKPIGQRLDMALVNAADLQDWIARRLK